MYTPSAFAEPDLTFLHRHIQDTRLAILVTHGKQGLQASHLPLLLDPHQGAHGTLFGHLARANPQWQELAEGAEALVIFPGADAYVSPSFYASKAEHGKVVPTWNYVAVHAYGQAEVFDDAERLRTLVAALTDRHEAGRANPWKVDRLYAQGHCRHRPADPAPGGQAQAQSEPQRRRYRRCATRAGGQCRQPGPGPRPIDALRSQHECY